MLLSVGILFKNFFQSKSDKLTHVQKTPPEFLASKF